jgi:hypothetical protein
MDFSKINFIPVELDSNNVYLYFTNFMKHDILKIENLKEKGFKNYADKQNKSIDEILELYDIGFNNGITKAKKTVKEKNDITPEAGKFYLFEIASTYNLHAKYYNNRISYHFKKFIHDEFEPKIFLEIGEIIGEFYYSWLQVLDNHRVFEPYFKAEIDKTKNNFLNKPFFPVHNVKIAELPESMNYAKDFAVTLERMNDIMAINFNWLDNGIMDNLNMNSRLRYDILEDLNKQFFNFLQETTNNTNNGIFEKHTSFYQRIDCELKKCIELFNNRAKKYFDVDMSFIYKYHIYNKNWFVIVSDYLNQTNESFQRITKFDNLITGFTCTLHPDTVKEVFNLMIDKKYLTGDLADFLNIFSNPPKQFKNPIKWLIASERGTNAGNGNKEALRDFLTKMLGSINADMERKIPFFFIDKKGNKMKLTKPKNGTHYNFKKMISTAKEKSGLT